MALRASSSMSLWPEVETITGSQISLSLCRFTAAATARTFSAVKSIPVLAHRTAIRSMTASIWAATPAAGIGSIRDTRAGC